MTRDELQKLVRVIQKHRMEQDAVEVKAAHHDRRTPKVYDSLSSLPNLPGGGIILLGLDEREGFAVVGVENLQKAQEDIANWPRAWCDNQPTV